LLDVAVDTALPWPRPASARAVGPRLRPARRGTRANRRRLQEQTQGGCMQVSSSPRNGARAFAQGFVMGNRRALGAVACAALGWLAGPALAQSVKIAYIDPLSGAFANVGEAGAAQFQAVIDDINAKGGVLGGRKLELVKFDNKTSP